MKLSFFRTKVVALAIVAVLLVGVTPPVANAASLPTLGTRLYWVLGSLLYGGMVSTGSATLDTTSVAGHWDVLPDFATATTLKNVNNSTANGFPYQGEFNAYVRGNTGSTTLRYSAACIPNPLKTISGGSGDLLELVYHAGDTNGHGGDIGFVKDCTKHGVGDATASGSDVINNVCTGTGCVSKFGSGSGLNWNNADYIKFTPRGKLGSDGGRITFKLLNVRGK